MYFRSMAIFHSFCVLSHPVFYILFNSFNFAATSNVVITPYYVVTNALQPHSNLKITVFIILECPSKCEFIVNIICYKNSHQCCGCVCKWNSYFIITSLPKGITCVQVNGSHNTRDVDNLMFRRDIIWRTFELKIVRNCGRLRSCGVGEVR